MNSRVVNIWIFAGVVGLITFFLLRPAIDFNAATPVEGSVAEIKERVKNRLQILGYSVDSDDIFPRRSQAVSLYETLKDSIPGLPEPAQLQRAGVPLTTFEVAVYNEEERQKSSQLEAFNQTFNHAPVRTFIDQTGQLVRLETHQKGWQRTWVDDDSLLRAASYIVEQGLGYDLSNYQLGSLALSEFSDQQFGSGQPSSATYNWDNPGDSVVTLNLTWQKKDASLKGPKQMNLSLIPRTMSREEGGTLAVQKGFSIKKFETFYLDAEIEKNPDISQGIEDETFVAFLIGAFLLLAMFVIVVGVRQLFQGRVELKRGIKVFIFVSFGVILWRALYLEQYVFEFLSSSNDLISLLNLLIYGLMSGLYVSVAYMGWESLARRQKRVQVNVVDGLWSGHFFFRETGQSLINGYALTGILMGGLALGLYGLDLYMFNYDSQFGYTEASSVFPVFTIPLNALLVAWLSVIGQVGVVNTFLSEYVKNKVTHFLISWVVMGILFAAVARFFGTNGEVWQDVILYSLLALPVYVAYRRYGMVTVFVGWGAFMFLLQIVQFLGSGSVSIITNALILTGILLLPLILGIISKLYGDSVMQVKGYVPEYEERIQRQLRFEKEIEIARESQFTLMPTTVPELPGIQADGFFIPSFEVGGDYFDYVIKRDENGEPERIVTVVIDVSGKAMKAAMHAILTSGLILSRIQTDTPSDVLRRVNPIIKQKTDAQTFITGVIADYDLKKRTLCFANAGHCHPILKRGSNCEFLVAPDPRLPLGFRDDVAYNMYKTDLQVGDIVILYSDGLPEAKNKEGHRYGFDATLSLIQKMDTKEMTATQITAGIKREIHQFSEYQMEDDTTVVCIKVV